MAKEKSTGKKSEVKLPKKGELLKKKQKKEETVIVDGKEVKVPPVTKIWD